MLRRGLVGRFRRGTSGSNLVEAAIITPLLLMLTMAIVDFASVFYVYLALENGVSSATRYAVTGNLAEDPENEGEFLSRED
jgi:Flp pilus assembly protein TadG